MKSRKNKTYLPNLRKNSHSIFINNHDLLYIVNSKNMKDVSILDRAQIDLDVSMLLQSGYIAAFLHFIKIFSKILSLGCCSDENYYVT